MCGRRDERNRAAELFRGSIILKSYSRRVLSWQRKRDPLTSTGGSLFFFSFHTLDDRDRTRRLYAVVGNRGMIKRRTNEDDRAIGNSSVIPHLLFWNFVIYPGNRPKRWGKCRVVKINVEFISPPRCFSQVVLHWNCNMPISIEVVILTL